MRLCVFLLILQLAALHSCASRTTRMLSFPHTKVQGDDTQSYDRFGGLVWPQQGVSMSHDVLVVASAPDTSVTQRVAKVYVFRRHDDAWVQEAALESSTVFPKGTMGLFGRSVSVHGDFIAVGEPNASPGSGLVYVYRYDHSSRLWTLDAILELNKADSALFREFGRSVSLHRERLLIGSSRDGAVLYQLTASGIWELKEHFPVPKGVVESDCHTSRLCFGSAVALSGNRLAIGSPAEADKHGGVYVYVQSRDGRWHQQTKLSFDSSNSGNFGSAVAMDGDLLVVGSGYRHGGAVAYRFDSDIASWSLEADLTQRGTGTRIFGFGNSVAISGDIIVVGAYLSNVSQRIWEVFHSRSSSITPNKYPGMNTGIMNLNPETVHFAGAAYLFKRGGGDWPLLAELDPLDHGPGDMFGAAVAVDGSAVAVAAGMSDTAGEAAGAVYVFDTQGDTHGKCIACSCSQINSNVVPESNHALNEGPDV